MITQTNPTHEQRKQTQSSLVMHSGLVRPSLLSSTPFCTIKPNETGRKQTKPKHENNLTAPHYYDSARLNSTELNSTFAQQTGWLQQNRLKHKNIVQLFDTYEDRERVYLVMEL